MKKITLRLRNGKGDRLLFGGFIKNSACSLLRIGSRSIPVTELDKRLGEIPKSGRVVVYAATASNDIPDEVFQLFEDERYKNVTVMLEGFQGWEKRKFPVETGRR